MYPPFTREKTDVWFLRELKKKTSVWDVKIDQEKQKNEIKP